MPSLPVDEEGRCVAMYEWQNHERTAGDERISKLCELHNLSWDEVVDLSLDVPKTLPASQEIKNSLT